MNLSTDEVYAEIVKELATMCHATSREKGWYDVERNQGEQIALMHAELSEALEALRKHNPPSEHCPEISSVEEEMADVLIRVLDFCAAHGHDIGKAVVLKMAYNRTRPHKHGGKAF